MKIDWQPHAPNVDVAIVQGFAIRRCKRGSKTVYIYSEREYPTMSAAWIAVVVDQRAKGAA